MLNGLTDPPLPSCQGRSASLDLYKHDTPKPSLCQAIEDNQVDWAAEETNILWVVREIGQVRDQLLVNLAGSDGLTPLDCILANDGSVPNLPE
jgi:hypothetical protein